MKLEGEEEKEDANGSKDINEKSVTETGAATTVDNNKPRPNPLGNSGFRRGGNPRMGKMVCSRTDLFVFLVVILFSDFFWQCTC